MLADVLVHREELADPSPVPAQVERVQHSHLLSCELKVEHVQVGSDPGRVRGLGHCGDPSLDLRKRKEKKSSLRRVFMHRHKLLSQTHYPSENDLRHALAIFLADGDQPLIGQQVFGLLRPLPLAMPSSKWAVRCDENAIVFCKFMQFFLRQEWVEFNLNDCWLDLLMTLNYYRINILSLHLQDTLLPCTRPGLLSVAWH